MTDEELIAYYTERYAIHPTKEYDIKVGVKVKEGYVDWTGLCYDVGFDEYKWVPPSNYTLTLRSGFSIPVMYDLQEVIFIYGNIRARNFVGLECLLHSKEWGQRSFVYKHKEYSVGPVATYPFWKEFFKL